MVPLHIAQLYHEGLASKFWSLGTFLALLSSQWTELVGLADLLLLCGRGAQQAFVIFDALALLLLEIKLHRFVQRRVVRQEAIQVLSNLVVSFINPVLDALELNFLYVLARCLFSDLQRSALRNVVRFVASQWQWSANTWNVFQAQFLLFILETEVEPTHFALLWFGHRANVVDARLPEDLLLVPEAVLT